MVADMTLAAVTLALRQRLEAAIDAVPGLSADVVSNRPDKLSATGKAVINLYLFQTFVDPFQRNADLRPVVTADNSATRAMLQQRWMVPLNLPLSSAIMATT